MKILKIYENEDLEEESFFDRTVLIDKKITGLKVDIFSEYCGQVCHKEGTIPRVIIGNYPFIVETTVEPKSKIISRVPKLNDNQMKKIKEAMKYVEKNYLLFLRHYQNNGNSIFDDDDLIKTLKKKGNN